MNAQIAPRNSFAFISAFKLLVIALTFLPISLVFNNISAQSYQEVPMENYGISIQSPTQYLQTGEKATIHIELGSLSNTISDAAGFDMQIQLGTNTAFDAAAAEGWINAAGGKLTVEYLESTQQLNLSFDANALQNGFGKVLALELTATSSNVDASKMVNSATGLMIIDNLDARWAQISNNNHIQAYPNPFQSQIMFEGGLDKLNGVEVRNLQGQLVAQSGPVRNLDLGHLSTGSYLLRLQLQDGTFQQQLIQKK